MSSDANLKVAFQGEPGAFSEMAVKDVFPDAIPLPRKSFREVFESLKSGHARFAALPVENSLAGSVHENYDLLLDYPDLHIVGEVQVRVSHCLLTIESATYEDIKTVISHPQALMQSSAFLDKYPSWLRQPFYDTAGSAAHVAATQDTTTAAIASEGAASVYGLKILSKAIENNPHNFTRFFVVARSSEPSLKAPNKTSIVFTLGKEAGSLAKVLTILAQKGLSLTKLESRPIHGKPWQYMFYADMELNSNLDTFEQVLKDLENYASELRLLGHYHSTLLIPQS